MRVAQSIFAAIEYNRKVAEYNAARQQYDAEADAYWSSVADQRRSRNGKRRGNQDLRIDDYVLTQPPVYAGPPRPIDPYAPMEEPPPRKYVPVVADLLEAAARELRRPSMSAASARPTPNCRSCATARPAPTPPVPNRLGR